MILLTKLMKHFLVIVHSYHAHHMLSSYLENQTYEGINEATDAELLEELHSHEVNHYRLSALFEKAVELINTAAGIYHSIHLPI